ncbi:substrate-binding domain-containing protein, partial [Porticoccus sp.]
MKYFNSLLLALMPLLSLAEDVSVAVASNFTAPMREIAAAFEQQSGHRAILAFGSSGKLYAQIHNGAPFQL